MEFKKVIIEDEKDVELLRKFYTQHECVCGTKFCGVICDNCDDECY